ncbi:A-kinase anchor protein 2-like isoform X3 [Brienomyrus brachyistius]|uniref:A-kinase anchor protein 2-like isoform X3 n=1 Tax=Brienomyrus brachyistius TaxID=42636 RepID=UPI0020B23E45|nr:A-kinase anchor protein 2-like isoform X3 [Brienomyrus brachyistius]
MSETDLQKERLQALALKRKRQAEIEEKRRKLEDLILRLQHLKSKAKRERWLLQGTSAATEEEEEERQRQIEKDEEEVKELEESIHRLENEIDQLKNEESEISAKELVLRERLRKSQESGVDRLNNPQEQDRAEAENHISSQNPDLLELPPQTRPAAFEDKKLSKRPVCAMEIYVQKDRKTGDAVILSASAVSPQEAQHRGVKVFDDGCKVVYEVQSGQPPAVENGLHTLTSSEVDKILQLVNQSHGHEAASRLMVTSPDPDTDASNGGLGKKEAKMHKEAKLLMMPGSQGKQAASQTRYEYKEEVTEMPEASSEKPVTMLFMGYHSVEDEEETKRLLGFNGTIKAEIVLIDEDDEKSLREKTVTDISTMDGNAADLVSGQPLSDTTEPSSEGKDESSDKELPAPGPVLMSELMKADCHVLAGAQIISTATRSSKDGSQLKREIPSKSVTFLDSVSVIFGGGSIMEAPPESLDDYHHSGGPDTVQDVQETLERDAAKEELHSDKGANCWDPDTASEETSAELKTINIPDTGASFLQNSCHDADMQSPYNSEAVTEGMKQAPFNIEGSEKHNGHSGLAETDYKNLLGDTTVTAIKKEPRFELRAFQEEKKPSKLFDTSEREQIHVKKVRPSEEMAELEKERLELIRGQAVKKNPGIAAKWWNPPQEKTLEEELDPEQLASHRRYEERKQKRPEISNMPPVSSKPTAVPVDPPEVSKEDVVMEQIGFSVARSQFLQMENNRPVQKRDVTPKIYSAKPFRTSNITNVERPNTLTADVHVTQDISEVTTLKSHNCYTVGESPTNRSTGSTPENEIKDNSETWVDDEDFTPVRAVMTFLKDEEPDTFTDSSFKSEESDDGLDALPLRPQGDSMKKRVGLGNVSDSIAPSETVTISLTDQSFSSMSHIVQTVNIGPDLSVNKPLVLKANDTDILTEEQIEYHAGILVQNAIQHAIAQQTVSQGPEEPPHYDQNNLILQPLEEINKCQDGLVPPLECRSPNKMSEIAALPIEVDSSSYSEPPDRSPKSSGQSEFSYFSKYSQAAELRSTASVTRNQDKEVSSGPFRLRSHKQRTLSMIEEEIRATQEREEELKRQRKTQCSLKKNPKILPSGLSPTGRTAPGKIEKIRPPPPVSPSSEGSPTPSISDVSSDDSAGPQRAKNFMQTLMEDYETHKVKRREKVEDASVLEATRVTRRKSNMAIRWEAGMYANQDAAEEEED